MLCFLAKYSEASVGPDPRYTDSARMDTAYCSVSALPMRLKHVWPRITSAELAESVCRPFPASAVRATTVRSRHSAVVRVTPLTTTLSFLALLVTGAELLISPPPFYWGEAGNVLTPPL